MRKTLRVGIVGFGAAGKYYLKAIRANNDLFSLVCVCDTDKSVFSEGIKFYTDLDKMMANEKIHTAIIAVPNSLHGKVAKKVVGKVEGVLLEKPATTNIAGLIELYEVARKEKTFLHVAYHTQFSKEFVWFLKNYWSGQMVGHLGALIGFSSVFNDDYLGDGNIAQKIRSLSGSWLDSGVNAISVLVKVFDSIYRTEGPIRKPVPSLIGEDVAAVSSFKTNYGGTVGKGTITTDWTIGKNYKCTELLFEKSISILLEHSLQQIAVKDASSNSTKIVAKFNVDTHRIISDYDGVLKDYYESFTTGKDNSEMTFKIHELLF